MSGDGARSHGAAVAEALQNLRPLLFSIAYGMVSSVTDAEDIVQDALLRYQRALNEGVEIESPKAYLSAVVTRLAVDYLRSARTRRETYVGEWLPEPLVTDGDDPAAQAEQADSLSMAFLLLLERLSPVERAVFLLHDVFGYGYDEIAAIVGKSEANCRQLALRARNHIQSDRPRFDASLRKRDELAARFFAAVTDGDLDGLVTMLAADVVVYGDGGGKAPQWMVPIVGVDRVGRLLAGLGRQLREFGIRVQPCQVNGQPGAIFRDPDGRVTNVWSLDIVDGVVQTLRSVINPDKLQHLGPVSDVRALSRRRTSERG
jgi:RNA polymerase sigma-70 factor (ECF subfamily)